MMPSSREISDDSKGLRVILVGRTPLEARLRRDDRIELLRSRDPLEAIGEIAHPIDGDSPRRTAVLVAPDAVRSAEAPQFAAAVRSIESTARVLSLNGGAGVLPGFDGALPADCDAEGLFALLGELDTREEAPCVSEALPRGAAPAATAAAASPAPVALFDDQAILSTLMAGGDPLEACLARVRGGLGAADVSFAPNGPLEDGASDGGVSVERNGVVFGRMRSQNAAPDALAGAAVWLAHWLALAEQQRQLRKAAFTDSLTGAWNRRYFDHFLARAIEQARQARHNLTVMVFDIDDFKIYNDRFGHAAGDEILSETVKLLKSVIRPTDLVCRIGGDEFAVIFNEPEGPRKPMSRHPSSINEIASRFQRQICEHRFPKLGVNAPSTLTISGGLATYPWDGSDPQALLERADQLAIESKRQGKNTITFGPHSERVRENPANP